MRAPRAVSIPTGAVLLVLWSLPCESAPISHVFTSARPDRTRAYYLYSLAQQARLERNFAEALKYLEEAVQSDESSDLDVELTEFYVSLNEYDEAEKQARRVLERDPTQLQARMILARILRNRPSEGEEKEQRHRESEQIYRRLVEESGDDEEPYLALADIQLDDRNSEAAAATLERYRSSHPSSSEVDLKLARIYQQGNRFEEAVSLLRDIVGKDSDDVEALEQLGSVLSEMGRYQEAVEIYAPIVDRNPRDSYGQYGLGMAFLRLGKYREAQEHLLLALEGDPGDVRILLLLGQSYEGEKRMDLAEGTYRRALEGDPASLEAKLLLARLFQGRADDDRALDLYQQILDQTSARTSPSERALFSIASSQVGVIRLLQKEYPAAVVALTEALRATDRPSDGLYVLLAQVSLAEGRIDDAGRVAAEGRKKYPESRDLAALQGELLLRQGENKKARTEFGGLLEREKGGEETYLAVLQACLRAERPREAEFYADEALGKLPGSKELRFQSAALEERLGHFRKAEKRFRVILKRNPQDAEALNYLGYMLAERGEKLQEALGFLQRTVAIDPNNAAYLDSLGWAQFRLGHYEQAETSLLKAARGSREDPTIYEHLGDVLARRGKRTAALDAYRTALKHSPDHPKKILKKIRKLVPASGAP